MTRSLPIVGLCALVGCTAPPEDPEPLGEARASLTVEEAVTAGCSTSQIAALSVQIIGQGNCIEPGAFSTLAATPNVTFGAAVLPYLEEPARDALTAALTENPGMAMQVNSMLRTVAQQYLLYRWYQAGTCGIGLAASPGNSNHETGLAIDIQQYDAWRPILEAKGFDWLGPSDPVHFDYEGPGAVDHRALGVLAFQQLWNLNHPDDLIDEDGIYGPQTEARIEQAPAEGFATGPSCGTPGEPDALLTALAFVDADDTFTDGPSADVTDLLEGRTYTLQATVANQGATLATGLTLTVVADDTLAAEPASLPLDDLAPGATVDVSLEVLAERYNVDREIPPAITVTLGTAGMSIPADVYSDVRWEWDGGRLEGWSAVGDADVTVADGALVIDGAGSATSPAIDRAADEVPAVRLRGSAANPGTLVVRTEATERVFNIDLRSGEAAFDHGLEGRVVGLRLDASSGMTVQSLHLEPEPLGSGDPSLATADGGCGCELAQSAPLPPWSWLAGLALALALARRGNRRPLSRRLG